MKNLVNLPLILMMTLWASFVEAHSTCGGLFATPLSDPALAHLQNVPEAERLWRRELKSHQRRWWGRLFPWTQAQRNSPAVARPWQTWHQYADEAVPALGRDLATLRRTYEELSNRFPMARLNPPPDGSESLLRTREWVPAALMLLGLTATQNLMAPVGTELSGPGVGGWLASALYLIWRYQPPQSPTPENTARTRAKIYWVTSNWLRGLVLIAGFGVAAVEVYQNREHLHRIPSLMADPTALIRESLADFDLSRAREMPAASDRVQVMAALRSRMVSDIQVMEFGPRRPEDEAALEDFRRIVRGLDSSLEAIPTPGER